MANKNGNTNTNSQPPKMPQPPIRNIDFQVDTIPERTGAAAYMTHKNNTITSNYVKGESEYYNQFNQSDYTLLHEQKHRDNINQGIYDYPVSPEQAYKLNMYDEISAMTTELIALRDEYIRTGDISVFDKDDSRFHFYKEAIEKGEINPRSNTKEDFDKDMRLIANGTKDMWMQKWAPTEMYIDECASNAVSYGDMTGKYAQYYDQNYERGKKIALTIGGVDFTQYLDNDVEIPEAGRKKIENLSYISNTNADDLKNLSNQELTKKFNIPAYDGSMSLQQYQDYLQHYFMSESLNPAALQNIENDKSALETMKQAGTENIKANEALINLAVTTAAQDYAKNGDKLPEANNEAYNNAVNKLYEVEIGEGKNARKINVRQNLNLDDKDFNDNLPITNLPEDVKNIVSENSSFWNRMKAKCNNLWDEVKNKFSDEDDEFDYDEDDNENNWIESAKKNEPINIIRKNKTPEYRQWANEDGSRVSEVQHRELPDMTKDVIRKPGKQVSAEQQSYSYTAQTKTTTATKQSYTAQADVKNASPQTSQNQSVKTRMKQAAASRAAAKPKPQKLNKPLKQQMSEDAKKYQTQKKVRRQQQQKTTAPRYDNTVKNDSIPTRQQIAPAMKIMQLRGVERSTPAKRVVKREVSGSIRRRQLTND